MMTAGGYLTLLVIFDGLTVLYRAPDNLSGGILH